MNTIHHIETESPPAGAPWFYCTFSMSGQRFVAFIPGNVGDGNGSYAVHVSREDPYQSNRPNMDYSCTPCEALEDDSLPNGLWVAHPTIDDGFSSTLPVTEINSEIERRLLGAVASAYLHPNARQIVSAVVNYFAFCDANRALCEEAQYLRAVIHAALRKQNLEYCTPRLASFGSRRAVRYLMGHVGHQRRNALIPGVDTPTLN